MEKFPPYIVQSISAFRVPHLEALAKELHHYFLVAHCVAAKNKRDVLKAIAVGCHFPAYFGDNLDALYDCLTSLIDDESVAQPGFIVVLEQLPSTTDFDQEAREDLLNVFRDAAKFWKKKKVPFRVFYSDV